jgi:hypothetical protein
VTTRVSRAEENDGLWITSKYAPAAGEFKTNNPISNPVKYSETYHLKRDGDQWTLTLRSQNSLHVKLEVWEQMKVTANKALEKKQIEKSDYIAIVPCLSDPQVAAKFKEIYSNLSEEQKKELQKLISKCYVKKWPVHLKEIQKPSEEKSSSLSSGPTLYAPKQGASNIGAAGATSASASTRRNNGSGVSSGK